VTSDDLLDGIKRARLRLTTAEADVRDAEGLLRDRKRALREARERYDAAIEEALAERRQPSLFDATPDPEPAPAPPAPAFPHPAAEPTWRSLTLTETGWEENLLPDVWAAIKAVPTAGELADRLLAGETFDLPLFDLESVYALVEMVSEDDAEPIDFDAPRAERALIPDHPDDPDP